MSDVYLSRIQLNPRRREARWLLSSPQRVHAAVLASFPEPPTGDRGGAPRVLWRLDREGDRVLLYVLSPDQPDFAGLAEQAGWPTTERGIVRPYGPLLDRLEEGQRWAFRLTANPTHYVRPDEGARARRVGHVTVGFQEQWLRERAEGLGFVLTGTDGGDLLVTRRSTDTFERRTDEAHRGRTVTLAVVQYDGGLEVRDPELLRRALVSGIGPAKAYGCGLLTLAPLG